MKFKLTFPNPLTHMIHVKAEYTTEPHAHCTFHLPMWRPGRYEAANYARNLRGLRFTNGSGQPLEAVKPQLSTWRVTADSTGMVVAEYEYFAFRMDAGSSWIDEALIYINFVNCLLYDPMQMNDPCRLQIDIPDAYRIATSLQMENHGEFTAPDFYTLADSPLLAAAELQEMTYTSGEATFHIQSWGHRLDEAKFLTQFRKFTEVQIQMMEEFPEPAYHFLLLFLPYKMYHGVEHGASTVICLGPADQMDSENMEDQLLGVSSHELFHAWNILKIRPRELFPYKFHEPAYFPTGFVAEGFTTYYGDLFLVRSGVRDRSWYLAELSRLLKRHFDNHGRLSLSVVDSSYDLWIDGYQKSAPGRKSSIYVEGAVAALMLDLTIRDSSGHRHSLDDVVRTLFTDFAGRSRGYTLTDILTLSSDAAGNDLSDFFERFITGTEEKQETLEALLGNAGITLKWDPASDLLERYIGIRLSEQEGKLRVIQIYPGSAGEQSFSLDDQIELLNGEKYSPDKFTPESGQELTFTVKRLQGTVEVRLTPDQNMHYFDVPVVKFAGDMPEGAGELLDSWLGTP